MEYFNYMLWIMHLHKQQKQSILNAVLCTITHYVTMETSILGTVVLRHNTVTKETNGYGSEVRLTLSVGLTHML